MKYKLVYFKEFIIYMINTEKKCIKTYWLTKATRHGYVVYN